MKQFIKNYWAHLVLIILGVVLACAKIANGELADSFIALGLVVVSFYATLLKFDYDSLRKEHDNLILDYIKELGNNLDFIKSTKEKVANIIFDVNNIKDAKPVAKKKRGRPRKTA